MAEKQRNGEALMKEIYVINTCSVQHLNQPSVQFDQKLASDYLTQMLKRCISYNVGGEAG